MSPLPPPSNFDSADFDGRVRSAYDADDAAPPGAPPLRPWAGLQAHLLPPVATPAPRSALQPAALGGAVGVLLGMLLMWWNLTPPAATTEAVVPSSEIRPVVQEVKAPRAPVASRHTETLPRSRTLLLKQSKAVARAAQGLPRWRENEAPGRTLRPKALATSRKTLPLSVIQLPILPTTPIILLPLVQTETALAALGSDTARATRESRRATLITQRAELATLTRRTDSLLLVLGVLPEVPPLLASTASSLTPVVDSVAPAPFRRWSVAATFAPERNFFGLNAPAGDTLSALRRTHEQGRGGYNAAVLAEYRVNQRWSVGAGLGVASYGAELRLTDRRTLVTVAYDTAVTTSTHTHQTTTVAFAVQDVYDPHLTPHFNYDGQVIGYDTVWVPRSDTTWTYLVNTDTVRTTNQTITPEITRREEVSSRILKPNYRFLTVPLLVRYRLGRAQDWLSSPTAPRWWADVAVGAQVQVFLGGTQLSTLDGRTYHTERVGPTGGPFRPVSVALLSSVALNYALTPRLSASAAPTLRWQAASVFKPSTNLTQRPIATGLQMGLKWAF